MAQKKGYKDYVFETISALNKRTEELQRELAEKQLAQEDLLHYIEFGGIDAIGRVNNPTAKAGACKSPV